MTVVTWPFKAVMERTPMANDTEDVKFGKHSVTDSLSEIQQTHWAQLGGERKAGSPILTPPLRPRQMLSYKSMFSFHCIKKNWQWLGGAGGGTEGKDRDRVRLGGGEEWGRGRVLPDSSLSLPPRLNFCAFLMAGASDVFPLIAIDVFQLYPWHFWQYVCPHKAFSDLGSCHLAQRAVLRHSASVVNRRGQGRSDVSLVLGLLCFSFSTQEGMGPHSLPPGEMETSLFKGERTGWKQGNGPTWGQASLTSQPMATVVDKVLCGERRGESWPPA